MSAHWPVNSWKALDCSVRQIGIYFRLSNNSHAPRPKGKHMSRLVLPIILLVISSLSILAGQDPMTVDATTEPSPPPRERALFPGSASPGHSAGLPIQLDLLIPTAELRLNGTVLVDFLVTTVGTQPTRLRRKRPMFVPTRSATHTSPGVRLACSFAQSVSTYSITPTWAFQIRPGRSWSVWRHH